MESYLEIEYIKGEPSKIRVKASNGYYSGNTDTYINSDCLIKLAKELINFPSNTGSVVIFESELGKNEESDLYLKFYCVDNSGHTAIRVCMKTGIYTSNFTDEAKFIICYEAAELDRFINSLKHIINSNHGVATLKGILKK